MVVFTCNHCGESLQKPRVEKHYSFTCRRGKFLTCVDCLKDFSGEEYVSHTKCISEEERYAAKGTFKTGIVKKGEAKQEQWSDMIKSILDDGTKITPKCKNLLNHIVNFTNVPRKKPKFMNFMMNTMGGRVHKDTVEEVWNIIESYKDMTAAKAKENNPENETTTSVPQNGDLKRKSNESSGNENNKKVKLESATQETDTNGVNNNGKLDTFQIEDEILNMLKEKESITFTKLHKKILKKYKSHKGDVDSSEFNSQLNEGLKKISNVVVSLKMDK